MKYLGIDYGSKKIGLALSDEAGTMGFPYGIVSPTPRLLEELCALVAKEDVGAVVLGESKNFKGEENPIAKDAHALGALLAERAGIPVFYEPEMLTSAEAKHTQLRAHKSRAPRARAPLDDSAAALILTSYLSRVVHE